jgi:hypothetical protein
MDIDSVVEHVHRLLLDNLPVRASKTPSGWITMNCPMCSDRRKRGGIITDGAKISYNCFNCGFKTGWNPGPSLGKKYKELVSKLGVTDKDIHVVQLELLKYSNELESLVDSEYVYSVAKFNTVELPEDVQTIESLPEDNELYQYARHRGLLGNYPLLHFSDMANRKRIIVPFTYNGELVGWVGRHVAPPNKETPKYLLNTQPGYVFNVDSFANDDRQIVIVCEGIFDAILVDGVSVLGNSVTPEQAHLIDKLGKRVILCPDRDKAGKKLIQQALELGWEVSFPPWSPDVKDAADAVQKYGRLATVYSIISHSTANKIKIEVKSKML